MMFTFDVTGIVIFGAIFMVALIWVVIADLKSKIDMLLGRGRGKK